MAERACLPGRNSALNLCRVRMAPTASGGNPPGVVPSGPPKAGRPAGAAGKPKLTLAMGQGRLGHTMVEEFSGS